MRFIGNKENLIARIKARTDRTNNFANTDKKSNTKLQKRIKSDNKDNEHGLNKLKP